MYSNSLLSQIITLALFLSLPFNINAENIISVSGDESRVYVLIDKFKDKEKSLSVTTKEAEQHCNKQNKSAKYESYHLTPGTGHHGAMVFYFCVSEDA